MVYTEVLVRINDVGIPIRHEETLQDRSNNLSITSLTMLLVLQLITLLLFLVSPSLAQFDQVTSGFFTMGTISVEGAMVGPVTGASPGVVDYEPSNPVGFERRAQQQPAEPPLDQAFTWAVVEYPQGWVLHLAAGNANAGSGRNVKLVPSYPGTFWNISEVDWHRYTYVMPGMGAVQPAS